MTLSGMCYICSYGETFDSIARAEYGDEVYAAELLCANPDLSNKYILDAGDVLALPVIYIPENENENNDTDDNSVTTAPWK